MRIRVTAPATVANVGPGFDAVAIALDLASEFVLTTDVEPRVVVEGEDAEELPADATNLVFRTISYVAREAGGRVPRFELRCRNAIPLQRGLGSSAAAVVAGVLLANALLDARLSGDDVLAVAADVEGHADNVAACLRGGVTIAYLSGDGWRAETLEPDPRLRPVVLVPEADRMPTADARRVIPRQIPHADGVFNAARSALLVVALTRDPDLLADALDDRLHQPYRLPHMPATRALYADLKEARIPVCVAGSGPSLLAFERDDARVWDLGPGWRVLRPSLSPSGATVDVDGA